MAKTVVLVTQAASTCPTYAQRLHQFFGSSIALKTFSVEAGDFPRMPTDADLYIIAATSSDAFAQISALIPDKEHVVTPSLTFFKKEIDALRQFPRGTQAMLVNLSVQMAYESIAELNYLGITQIEFIPVYPGSSYPPDVTLAITPGESRYVPPTVLQVIDLGPRVFTTDTLLKIALKLGFTWFPKSAEFCSYAESLAHQGQSLAALWRANLKAESYLDILMGTLETGILGIDVNSCCFAVNDLAESMLGLKKKESIGQSFHVLCPALSRQLTERDCRHKTSRLIQLKGTYFNLTIAPVDWQGEYIGCFLLLQRFTAEEERQQQFRLQMYHRGYQSKYTFDDIIGQSDAILRTKQIAARMAATDSAILLTGESGTGKELFAHSIHNASRRRNLDQRLALPGDAVVAQQPVKVRGVGNVGGREAHDARVRDREARLSPALTLHGAQRAPAAHLGVQVLLVPVMLAVDLGPVRQEPAKVHAVETASGERARYFHLQVRHGKAKFPHGGARNGLASVLAASVGVRGGHARLGDAAVASVHLLHIRQELLPGEPAHAQRRVGHGQPLPKVQPAHAVKGGSQQRGHRYAPRLSCLLVRYDVAAVGLARPDPRAGRHGKVNRSQKPMGDREPLQDGGGGPAEAPGGVELVQRPKNVQRTLGGGEPVEPALPSCIQPRQGRDKRSRAHAPVERPAEVLVGRGQADGAKLCVIEQQIYGFVDARVHVPPIGWFAHCATGAEGGALGAREN